MKIKDLDIVVFLEETIKKQKDEFEKIQYVKIDQVNEWHKIQEFVSKYSFQQQLSWINGD